MEAAMFRG
jgi:Fic family protein